MNSTDAHATSYVATFWPEKPQPIKGMLHNAYVAGTNDFRGQAAIAAMQAFISRDISKSNTEMAKLAVDCADALISELQKTERNGDD